MQLSDRLKSLRREKGLSQGEIAKILGYSGHVIISHWETGKAKPDIETIVKLSKLYNVTVDYIVQGDNVAKEKAPNYPLGVYRVLGEIPAGKSQFLKYYDDYIEMRGIQNDPETHFWLKVDKLYSQSMLPFLRPGDYVLCSVEDLPKEGDLVAAEWGEEAGIKFVKYLEDDKVLLYSFNANYPVFAKRREEVTLYKIKLIERI